jgi:Prealbumin-like fold domain
VGAVRQAANAFLDSLRNTKSTATVIQFAESSKIEAPRTVIDDASLSATGVLHRAVQRYYDGSVGQYTNWAESLADAGRQTPAGGLVVFVTDGEPNRPGRNPLADAVAQANQIKQAGSRFLVIGVGSAVTGGNTSPAVKHLGQISGGPASFSGDPAGKFQIVRDSGLNQVTDLNKVDVALVSNFNELGQILRKVFGERCTPSLTIRKFASSATSGNYDPVPGWEVSVTPSVPGGSFDWVLPDKAPAATKTLMTDAQGFVQFQWEPMPSSSRSQATVRETARSGFTSGRPGVGNDYFCQIANPDNDTKIEVRGDFADPDNPSFTFPNGIPSNGIVTCSLYNTFVEQPGIAIKKSAPDTTIRGNGAGWNLSYEFEVTNTGNVPLKAVAVSDPQCTLTGTHTGDENGDEILDPSEKWVYSCTRNVRVGDSTQPVLLDNTAVVRATTPTGTPVTSTSNTVTVDVRTPGLKVVKTARANGQPIPEGGAVPAGSRVTYTYTVTNAGNDPLRNVTGVDDRCTPVSYVSGDTNGDQRLDTDETWQFECTTSLTPPSTQSSVTNTATFTGYWSNPNNRPTNNSPVTAQGRKTVKVTRTATLHVIKSASPAGVDREFPFTVSGTGVGTADQSFSLNPGSTTPTASRAILVQPDAVGSSYTITESGVDGWDLTDIHCDTTSTKDLATGTVTLSMTPGQDVTCTFTNKRRPVLTVVKQTQPHGDTTSFPFTASRPILVPQPTPGTFDLFDGQSQRLTALAPGSITVTEGPVPAGWKVDQVSCTKPGFTGDPAAGTATGVLEYGDEVVCTFSNVKLAPATITVVKSGTTGVTTKPFTFTATGDGLLAPGDSGEEVDFDVAIGKSHTLTVHPAEGGTGYTVAEAAAPPAAPDASDWVLTDLVCTVNGQATTVDTQGGTVTSVTQRLLPGDHATCTFTNQTKPRLTISKQVVVGAGQSGADQTFDFTTTGLAGAAPSLGNGDTETYANLTPGAEVAVREILVAGWNLSGMKCSGPGALNLKLDKAKSEVVGALGYGDDAHCTFTNTKDPTKPATLTIVKQVDPATDGPSFPFTLTGTRVPPADADFALDPDGTGLAKRTVQLIPDESGSDYTLTEAGAGQALPSGWDYASAACTVDGAPRGTETPAERKLVLTLNPGESATCTFVNKPKARLTIAKQVALHEGQVNDHGDFDFTTTGLGGVDPSLGDGESHVFTQIASGTDVSVTEPAVSGWTTTVACVGTGSDHYAVSGSTVSGTAVPGDDVTCTYTNTKEPAAGATLTVTKKVTPKQAAPTFGFTLSASNPDPGAVGFSLTPTSDGKASQTFSLAPFETGTTYALAESTLPAGWDFTSLECAVNGTPVAVSGSAASLTLRPLDAASCTFVNKPKATLRVVKQVSLAAGQVDDASPFSFAASNLSVGSFALSAGQSRQFDALTAGTAVYVEEPAVAGWTTAATCTGTDPANVSVTTPGGATRATITPVSGEQVTCTFTNTKDPLLPAVLAVGKLADPVGSDLFDFTASGTGLDIVQQPGSATFSLGHDDVWVKEVFPEEPDGDSFVVTESDKAGWDRVFIECADSGGTLVDGNLGTGAVTLPLLKPGQVALCLFVNQERGSLTVVKHTNAQTSRQFAFTADGVAAGPAPFTLTGGESKVFADLAAGTQVTVTESVPSGDGEVPDRWVLSDLSCTGAADPAQIDKDAARTTVTVGAGEDVVCTYSDAKVPTASLSVIKQADPARGVAFDFTASGNHSGVLPDDRQFTLAPDAGSATRTLTLHPPAEGETYTVAEILSGTQATEWELTALECTSGGQPAGVVTGSSATLELLPGQAATCTFSNRQAASLTVAKSAPDDPDASFPFRWSIGEDFELSDGSISSAFPLDPGTYTVQELVGDATFPADWHLNGDQPVCTGSAAAPVYGNSGAEITIAPGEDVWCTFVNQFDYDPAMQLTKSADPEVILSGTTVTYSFELYNSGNTPLELADGATKADVIDDDQCSPVAYQGSDGNADDVLDVGETWTFTCASAPLTQDTLNTATATMVDRRSTPGTPRVLTATDSANVIVLSPAIQVDKYVDKDVIYAGTEVRYDYEVYNLGEVPLVLAPGQSTGDVVVDDKCGPVTYLGGDEGDDGVLDLDETWVFECSTSLMTDTTNVATATLTPQLGGRTGPPISSTDTRTVDVVAKGIALTKSVSGPGGVVQPDSALAVQAGTLVTYTYKVTTGAADTPMRLLDSVSDDRCDPVTYVGGDADGDGLVDLDETWTFTCSQVIGAREDITNTATVRAVEPRVGGTSTDTDKARVVGYAAAISVHKEAGQPLVAKGATSSYTYEVRNTGQVPLGPIMLADDKCSPVTRTAGDANGDGLLDLDEVWEYTCSVALQAATTNTAVVTGRTPFGTTVTSTAKVPVGVVGTVTASGVVVPSISVTKAASATTVAKGGEVSYTYAVTNTGAVGLAGVEERITDDRCSNVQYVSGDDDGDFILNSSQEPGEHVTETWIFTCTTTLSRTTTNTVVVLGTPVSAGKTVGPDVTATAKATVTVPGTSGPTTGGTTDTTMPPTGADLGPTLIAALLLLAAGGVAVRVARARR